MYVYIYQPFRTSRILYKVNFYAEVNKFEFRDFLRLDWLPNQAKESSLPCYLPIAGGKLTAFIPLPTVLKLY